jgi:ketosteroid isomerase-like protein
MLGALVLALSALVSAQAPETKKAAPPAPAAGQDTEAVLMKMERDAAAALTKRDIAGFGSIMAEDAVFTGPDGAVQTKAQLLADVKAGDLVIESTTITDLKVRVFGDSAVATYTTTDKGKSKGRDISGRYRWTDTFVRRGGKWQIVAGQGTPIQ